MAHKMLSKVLCISEDKKNIFFWDLMRNDDNTEFVYNRLYLKWRWIEDWEWFDIIKIKWPKRKDIIRKLL